MAARRIEEGNGPDLPTVAGYAFMGFGAMMIVGGIVLVFDDPAGFALAVFGLVFVGAGYLARRLFAAPEGSRAVLVSAHESDIQNVDGTRGARRQASVIYVDENASEEEIEAAKEAWLREQWEHRPDWVAGRIVAEDERSGNMAFIAAGLWSAFALAAAIAAFHWGGIVWFFAAMAAVVAGTLIVLVLRSILHRRKFGASYLVLAHTPAFLGEVLEGTVESGVPLRLAVGLRFLVRLRCLHRWEESDYGGSNGSRRTVPHCDTLWEDVQRNSGHVTHAKKNLLVPIKFQLPVDQPASTLANSAEGITWEAEVTAEMEGLDYHATFQVPVFQRGDDPRRLGE